MATSTASGTDAAVAVEKIYMDKGVAAAAQALQTDFQNAMNAPGGKQKIADEETKLNADDPSSTGALTALAANWAASHPNIDYSEGGLVGAIGANEDYGKGTASGQYDTFMLNTINNRSDAFTMAGEIASGGADNNFGLDNATPDSTDGAISFTDIFDLQRDLEQIRLNGGKPVEAPYTPPPPPSLWEKIEGGLGLD